MNWYFNQHNVQTSTGMFDVRSIEMTEHPTNIHTSLFIVWPFATGYCQQIQSLIIWFYFVFIFFVRLLFVDIFIHFFPFTWNNIHKFKAGHFVRWLNVSLFTHIHRHVEIHDNNVEQSSSKDYIFSIFRTWICVTMPTTSISWRIILDISGSWTYK